MPKLSVWMIRASLIHMGIGFLFGALILFHKGIPILGWSWELYNHHQEWLIFGWTMQFVMGVAYFALPRFTQRDRRYGASHLGWLSFGLLNSGVVSFGLADWFGWTVWVLLGRLLIMLGIVSFVVMIWPRVKPYAVG